MFAGKVGCSFVGETDFAQLLALVHLCLAQMGW